MTTEESHELAPGLYLLYWTTGGKSLASVGILRNGDRWFAPANWTGITCYSVVTVGWLSVKKAALIAKVSDFS